MSERLLQEILKELKRGGKGGRTGVRSSSASGMDDVGAALAEIDPKAWAEIRQHQEDIARLSRDTLAAKREEGKILRKMQNTASARQKELVTELTNQRISLQAAEQQLALEQDKYELLLEESEIKLQNAALDETEKLLLEMKLEDQKNIVEAARAEADARGEVVEKTNEASDALDEITESTDVILQQLGLSGKAYEKSFFGQVKKAGLANAVKQTGFAIGQAISPTNLLGSATTQLFQATVQAVGARDRTVASFNAATGAGGKYNEVIQETYRRTDGVAITFDEAAAGVQDLATGFGGFANIATGTQKELGQLVSGFEKLGVSGATSVQFLDTSVKALGMSAPQAAEELKKTALAADALGIPVAKFTADLAATMPKLAAFGQRAPEVFRKTAAVADRLGLSTGELVGAMDQFTTFRGAAESAGKLNAMLGGTINSMELVAASAKGPDEALKVLRKGVNASGKSFEDLGFFGKKAIADSIGVDAQTAAKLFSGEIGSVEEATKAAEEAGKKKADQDAKLTEMMNKAIPAATKFTELFNQMAPAVELIIGAFHALLDPLMQFVQFIGPEATAAIMGLAGAFVFMRNMVLASRAAKIAENTATALQTIASSGYSAAKGVEAGASQAAAGSKVAEGAANIKLAGTQKVLAGTSSLMATSFATLAGLALAMLAFGVAVALAGVGINLMFENVDLEKVLSLVGFFAAVALGAPFIMVAAVGLLILSAGMLALGLALLTVKTEDLQALGQAMEGMGRAAEAGGAPLTQMIDFLDHLEDVADDIDEDGLEGIASVFRNIANIPMPEGGAGGIMSLLNAVEENSGVVNTIVQLTDAIEDLAFAMSLLGISGLVGGLSVSYMFDSLSELENLGPDAVAAIDGTVRLIESTAGLDVTAVEQAETLLENAADFLDSANDAAEAGSLRGVLEKLTGVFGGGDSSGSTSSGGAQQPIVLAMDAAGRKILARGIIKDLMPEINKKLDARLN